MFGSSLQISDLHLLLDDTVRITLHTETLVVLIHGTSHSGCIQFVSVTKNALSAVYDVLRLTVRKYT